MLVHYNFKQEWQWDDTFKMTLDELGLDSAGHDSNIFFSASSVAHIYNATFFYSATYVQFKDMHI
jgi:hypothetical protein